MVRKKNKLSIQRCIEADLIKLKGSKLMVISVLGIVVFPILVFTMFFIESETFIPKVSEQGLWIEFINSNLKVTSRFILPFYIILAAALLNQIEYNSKSWKSLLCLPYRKTTFYISKLSVLTGFVFFVYMLFLAVVVTLGLILGIFFKEYLLTINFLPVTYLYNYLFHSFISILGILAIHNYLSLIYNNQILTIGIGLISIIISLILYFHEDMIYFPYAYSILTVSNLIDDFEVVKFLGLPVHEIFSCLFFVIFSLLGGMKFSRKQLKS